MSTLTIIQTAGLFCAYLGVMVGLPAFVFGRKLAGHRLHERFMIYLMIGNFYVMNLVLLLQQLKISYPVTLILGTLLPAVGGRIAVDRPPVRAFAAEYVKNLKRLAGGQMGFKSFCYKAGRALRRQVARFCRWAGGIIVHRPVDCILTVCILAALCWYYGSNILQELGYKASDVPVHNYWINAMNDNNIFVAGVYPHGFHCVMHYLHAVFGFDTYVLLRLTAFLETVMIHLMLLCFLRLCCKNRYAAYLGMFAYLIADFCRLNTYQRYNATLPQEYGMIFILPAVYFGFAYFRVRREELAEETTGGVFRRRSFVYLAGFAMSFAMTLMVHFYGTMVAGIFCAAMAAGYCFLFFRRKYFWNVVVTCLISVVLAVLPMAVAFIGGKPLEGSLRWGMSIITGSGSDDGREEDNPAVSDDGNEDSDSAGQGSVGQESMGQDSVGQDSAEGTGEESGDYIGAGSEGYSGTSPGEGFGEPVQDEVPRVGGFTLLMQRLKDGWVASFNAMNTFVVKLPHPRYAYWVMYSYFVLILMGVVFLLLRRTCYGAMLISTGVHHLIMSVLLVARAFGLPSLMDTNRTSIYLAYTLPLVLSFLVDGVLCLLLMPVKGKAGTYIGDAVSLVCVAGFAGIVWQTGWVKEQHFSPGQEMNEAIVCLANIIESEKDFTWTICSTNDEMQMGMEHGFHYEISSFLEKMEVLDDTNMIRIPTPVVYFFVEKVPLDYYLPYENSGQAISEEGASRALPANLGISMYQGEKRWITMSRLYYWAQEFQNLYPNEMQVYLETDRFVCYRVEQDMNKLFNFAIDYGYNVRQ